MYDELVNNIRLHGFLYDSKLAEQAADAIEDLEFACNHYEKDYKALCNYLPRWISVEERLPLAYKDVYVTDGEYIARSNLLGDVFPGDQPCWSYSGLGEITHWCERIPLPEPPKEEHNGNV